MSLKDLCANSLYTDTYETKQNEQDRQFNDTYLAIENLFSKDLTEATCQEDIESDLIFEIGLHIDSYSYSIDKDDVAKQLYANYELKEAV